MLKSCCRHRTATLLLALLFVLPLTFCTVGGATHSTALDNLLASTPDDQLVPVVLFLENPVTMDEIYPVALSLPMSERRAYVIRTLKSRFAEMSAQVLPQLNFAMSGGAAASVRPLWILNAVRVKANPRMLRTLDELPEIGFMAADLPFSNTLDNMGWGIREMQVDHVWADLGVDGSGVIVGHKDAGLDVDHPGFAGHLWVNPGEDLNGNGSIDGDESNNVDDDANGYVDDFWGWDFDRDENNVNDSPDAIGSSFGHGSRTAGVISANLNTPCDTTCVAPGAKLMVLSAFVLQGAVWEASQYAIEMGAHVISASLSFKQASCTDDADCPNYVAHRMVSEMELAAGILHANSTGNSSGSRVMPAPANSPPPVLTPMHPQQGGVSSIVSVNAYSSTGNYSSGGVGPTGWSEEDICTHPRMAFCGPEGSGNEYPERYNDYPYQNAAHPGLIKPDISAPTSVNTMNVGGTCSVIGGTSGATPHVGGAIALIYSAFPGITPEDAYLYLVENAQDAGVAGYDSLYGFGKVRPFPAIAAGNEERGTVEGVITSGGQPLVGVRVLTDSAQTMLTNDAGEYAVSLPAGTYMIRYAKHGYIDVLQQVVVVAGQTVTQDITMAAAQPATVVGSVSGAGAGALGGITVVVDEAGVETVTDPTGQFILNLFEGSYTIRTGGLPWEEHVLEIGLEPGTLNLDIVLNRSVRALPTGPDSYGYYIYDNFDADTVVYEWVEINPNAGGLPGENITTSVGNDGTVVRGLPFTFRFYGTNYTQITISANGFIMLGSGSSNEYAIQPIPSTVLPNGFLAPWYSDWQPAQTGGRVLYYSDAANHRVIVEWYNAPHYWGGQRVTFQAILYDPLVFPTPTGDGMAKYQYNTVTVYHEETIGLENADGTNGLQYAFQMQYEEHAAPLAVGRALLVTTDSTLGISAVRVEREALPQEFSLAQNYPNPFNPSTTFTFTVPRAADVRLALYDVLGREAAVVFAGRLDAGEYRQEFVATDLATGIYFARLSSGGQALAVRKVMLLK